MQRPGRNGEPNQGREHHERHHARLHQGEIVADRRQARLGKARACRERPAVVCAFADERHASDLSEGAIARAVEAVRAVKGGHSGTYADAPSRTNRKLYTDDNPLGAPAFDAKVKLLESIDAYARGKDARVRQVTANVAATWQVVEILRADGEIYRDIRPLVRLNVSVVAGDGDRQESGSYGFGGREGFQRFIAPDAWRAPLCWVPRLSAMRRLVQGDTRDSQARSTD